jgi:hypothetical protein
VFHAQGAFRFPICLAVLMMSIHSAAVALGQDLPYFLHERFEDARLTGGLWDARFNLVTRKDIDPCQHGSALAGFNLLGGGYLLFWQPAKAEEPSIYSVQTFDRRPGRCLSVAYCGTVCRGMAPNMQFADSIRPADKLRAGPGWTTGQRMHESPYRNVAIPFGPTGLGPTEGHNSGDTLMLTVLRRQGAFYLLCGEAISTPPKAKLCFVLAGRRSA